MRAKKRQVSNGLDRLPPHSQEAEQCVLGCVLLDPVPSMGEAISYLPAPGAQCFYDLRHQTIYSALVVMHDDRRPINTVTLCQWLKDRNLLEEVGGMVYVASLADMTPSAAGIGAYLETVREKHLLRMTIRACTDVVSRVYEYEGHVDSFMDSMERDMMAISQARVRTVTPNVRELVRQAIQDIEDCHLLKGKLSGLATGFGDLDKYTGGLQPADMIVIAARPSMGKTSLAMNIVEQVCIEDRNPVGVFSLEMSARALMRRMVCSRARVNMRNVAEGFITEREFPKITASAGKISTSPLHIDDTSGLSILQLRAKARQMFQLHGIKLFVIDYLQLLNALGGPRRLENRQQEVADISTGIKGLAKELGVPIIVLSQLNRDLEREKNRKPRLSDLRESGAVEQDADAVCFLYKPNCNDGTADDYSDTPPINLLIAKQRNGASGVDVNLIFFKSWTRFESAAKVDSADIPENDRQVDMDYRNSHPDA